MAKHYVNVGPGGDCYFNDQMLIVRYPEGDVDVVNTKMDKYIDHLHRALYDEYQCGEVLKDGDEIVVQGKVRFRCEHVHVIRA